MILEIVQYGHPVLREKGAVIANIDGQIRKLAEDMLETMYDAHGVGLAAQQVAVPLQLTVIDVTGVEDRPSRMWVGGREVEVESAMPLVLVNPEVTLSKERDTGIEGCLSFPDITSDVERASRVSVRALDLDGGVIEFDAEGLLARAVQHETDHLHGILFIDRISSAAKVGMTGKLKRLAKEGKARAEGGK